MAAKWIDSIFGKIVTCDLNPLEESNLQLRNYWLSTPKALKYDEIWHDLIHLDLDSCRYRDKGNWFIFKKGRHVHPFFFLFAALLEDFLVQDERNQVSNTSMEALTSKASISWSSPGISTESVDKDPGKWDEARSASIQKGHGCSLRWRKQSDNMVSGKWLWKWLLELIQLSLKHIYLYRS